MGARDRRGAPLASDANKKGPRISPGPSLKDATGRGVGARGFLHALPRLCALSLQLGGDHRGEFDGAVAVAPLVVVPGDELEEGLVELDGAAGIVDAGALVVDEVAGNDLVGGIAEDALEIG